MKYLLTFKHEFDAMDDIEAREKVRRICESGLKIGQAVDVALKLQRINKRCKPDKVTL